MPSHLKLIVSIVTLIASTALFWFDTGVGAEGAARWLALALALGPVAVFAIWVFPEAEAKEIRREAATQRPRVS